MNSLAHQAVLAPDYYDETWVMKKLDIGPLEAAGGRGYRVLFFPPSAAELCLSLEDFGDHGRLTLVTARNSLWTDESYRVSRYHGFCDDELPPAAPRPCQLSRTVGADWMQAFREAMGDVDLIVPDVRPWAVFGEALSIYREYCDPNGRLHTFPARHVDFQWAPSAYRFTAAIVSLAWDVFPDEPAAGFLSACTSRED